MMLQKKPKGFAKKVLQLLKSESTLKFKESIEEFHTSLETKIDPAFDEINLVNEIDSFIEKFSNLENKISEYLGKNQSSSLATKLYKLQQENIKNDINVI